MSGIAFKSLQNLDVVEALVQFDLRRTMTKTGRFKAIEPFAPVHERNSVTRNPCFAILPNRGDDYEAGKDKR
jgi:hypothetical protein